MTPEVDCKTICGDGPKYGNFTPLTTGYICNETGELCVLENQVNDEQPKEKVSIQIPIYDQSGKLNCKEICGDKPVYSKYRETNDIKTCLTTNELCIYQAKGEELITKKS